MTVKATLLSAASLADVVHRIKAQDQRRNIDLLRNAKTINVRHPGLRRSILTAADLALSGHHVLPGTGGKPHFMGDPIDWFSNPFNDNEYVWSLNRMDHWPVLMQATLLSGDSRYAGKVVSEWSDWLSRCPTPDVSVDGDYSVFYGVNPWRMLEVGIRCFDSWPTTLRYLVAAEMITPDLLEKIAGAFHGHARALSLFSPKLYPHGDHNHYLMEMLGLFSVACRFPEFPESDRWRQQGLQQLERCMDVQITNEGGQLEGCPYYHSACVQFFARALTIAREGEVEFFAAFVEKYRKTVDYALHATRPTGVVVPWGDSDPDRQSVLAAFHTYLATGDLAPLRALAHLGEPGEFLHYCERFVWDVPDFEEFRHEIEKPPVKVPRLVNWQRTLDQATVRSDWTGEALSLFFGCRLPSMAGRLSVDLGGHTHIDLGSFDLTALGKALIVDPGRFTYREDADRYEFKRASSHNMFLVDDRDPVEYRNTWRFGPEVSAGIIEVRQENETVTMVAEHANYHPAIHRRTLMVEANQYVVLVDEISGLRPEQTTQIYFNLDSKTLERNRDASCVFTRDRGANVAIYSWPKLDVQFLSGRASERMDVAHETTRLRLGGQGDQPYRRFVTVIVPFKDENVPTFQNLEFGEDDLLKFVLNGREYGFKVTRMPSSLSV